MEQQTTAVHEYHGRAMADLPDDTTSLQIFCPELSPGAAQGTFKPGVTTADVSLKLPDGSSQTTQEIVSNHIVAEWFGSSNRAYPPNVVAGEQVKIYQFANSDKLYWDSLGRDRELRKTETLRFEIGATNDTKSTKTDENTYFIEMSSKKKHLLVKLSKKLGEKFAYVFKIDAAAGITTFTDDAGSGTGDNATPSNSIIVNSADSVIQFTNHSKTTVSLHDQDVLISAPRDIMMTAKRQILLDSPAITFNRSSTGTIVFNSTNITANATDFMVNSARIGLNGVVKAPGPLVLGPIRTTSMVTGAVGGAYAGSSIDINNGVATSESNDTDTDTSGSGDREIAAWPQVVAAFAATATALKQVATAAKTSVDTSAITKNADKSKVPLIKGE